MFNFLFYRGFKHNIYNDVIEIIDNAGETVVKFDYNALSVGVKGNVGIGFTIDFTNGIIFGIGFWFRI